MDEQNTNLKPNKLLNRETTQPCPQCLSPIGIMRGSMDAICKNCGFKDPCCGD